MNDPSIALVIIAVEAGALRGVAPRAFR